MVLPPAGKTRPHSLTLHFSALLYARVSRSLFEQDKLAFSVLMMTRFVEVRSGRRPFLSHAWAVNGSTLNLGQAMCMPAAGTG